MTNAAKLKLYKSSIGWPISSSKPPPHAVTGPSACQRPQEGAEAQCREPPPSRRQETWAIGGISYLNGIILDTGVGGWGKLGAQTRAEAKGAEI